MLAKKIVTELVVRALKHVGVKNLLPHQVYSILTIDRLKPDTFFESSPVKIVLPVAPLVELGGSREKISHIANAKPNEVIKKIEINPEKGLITFFVDQHWFIDQALNLNDLDFIEGKSPRRKVLVEYSSPNIAKPFHMGHLRSTIIGNFVSNVEEVKNDVVRINYLGDWGTQIGLIRVGLEKLRVSPSELSQDPLRKIYECYVEANKDPELAGIARSYFTQLERGNDQGWMAEWQTIRRLTSDHLRTTYEKLGVSFDEYSWESNYMYSKIKPIIQHLKEQGLAVYSNGNLNVDMEGKMIPLLKSDGSTLYLSRDVGAAVDRVKRHNCDKLVYVVDKSQSDHLRVLKRLVDGILGKGIVEHVPFGRVVGMSTRKGTGVFLSEILDKATDLMAEQQLKSPNTRSSSLEVTSALATSTLKVYILKQRRMKDFRFDWGQALQGTGDSGVKLQYTHARLYSLERKSNVKIPNTCLPQILSQNFLAVQLVVEISRFEEALQLSSKEMEPYILVNFLFSFCNLVSRCLKLLQVKGESEEIAQQRLLLFHKSRLVINKGMKILGVDPLVEM